MTSKADTLSSECAHAYHSQAEDLHELLDGTWDEARVLENLRLRFLSGKPYTGVGDVIIAVNASRSLADLYDRETQLTYMRYNRTDLPAHAYATSAASYWAICEGRGRGRHQVIMVAGESGSGKTFTHSLLVEHLVAVAEMSRSTYFGTMQNTLGVGEHTIDGNYDGGESEWFRKLEACRRTIFESFGNVETPSNRNSSRFMTHTKVFYSDDATRVLGTEAETLLLETSRLSCGQASGNGTFHVFYQVLNSDESIKRRLHLGGRTALDFAVTSTEPVLHRVDCGPTPGVSANAVAWASGAHHNPDGPCGLQKVLDAMTVAGVGEGERNDLLRGLAAILHLGKVDFVDVRDEDFHRDFGVIQVSDEAPLKAASEMLGCNKDHLRNALLTRSLAAGGEGGASFVSKGGPRRARGGVETLTVPLNKAQALSARDKLAQEVYLRLFRWLVKKTNACTGPPSIEERAKTCSIGVLDTCGLETFDLNGFEQLCKNYASEKTRWKFLQDEVCSGAGGGTGGVPRSWSIAHHVAKSRQLLAMFEDPLGLIRLADDECLCPEGNGRSFVEKLLLAADDEERQQRCSDGGVRRGPGCNTAELKGERGGGGPDGKGAVQIPGLMCAGSGRGEFPGVETRGASSGGGGSAWPVYTNLEKIDGGSREGCVFHIRHFVGAVRYTAADIVEKNRGGIGQNLLDLLDDACANVLVGEGSRSSRYREGRRASAADGRADHRQQNLHQRSVDESVLSRHRRQLTSLLREIEDAEVRHILCVKPNNELSPSYLDGTGLLRQLSAAGVAAAAQKGMASLPAGRRVDKAAFFQDFTAVPRAIQRVLNNNDDCCKLGHDTIFFREGVWESFERRREAIERRSCEVLQGAWRQHTRRVHAKAEWERYLAFDAEKRAAAARRQRELERMQHAWEEESRLRDQSAAVQRVGVFDSSHANAVREVQRAKEAAQAAAAAAEATAQGEEAWRCHRQDVQLEEARLAAAAERTKRDEAIRTNCSTFLHPPPAVVHAWPVEQGGDDGNNDDDNEVPEPAATSTTPPMSPRRSHAPPICSPVTGPLDCGGAKSEAARRDVPRLAGLADYAMRVFLTEPVHQKYGTIRCRVTRWKGGAGWNPLAPPAYCMHHIEGSVAFMMSASPQLLSRTANYYISASPVLKATKESEDFLGKLRARDGGGSSYTLYDHGVSPGRSSKDQRRGLFTRAELARVVFTKTEFAADGPRSMEVFLPSPVERRQATDVARRRAAQEGNSVNRVAFRLERSYCRDGCVRLRDRKPRYDRTVGAYVLDFADPTSKLSIKNVQLVLATNGSDRNRQQRRSARRGMNSNAWEGHSGSVPSCARGWEELEEEEEESGWSGDEITLLSFGKLGRDSFSLDFRWPLTPMQAFGLALAAMDTTI